MGSIVHGVPDIFSPGFSCFILERYITSCLKKERKKKKEEEEEGEETLARRVTWV